MSGDRPSIYWDTNIFLVWLKDEKREDPAAMQGVKEAVDSFDTGRMIIVTSVVTIVEVLENSLSQEAAVRFRSLTQQRPNDFFLANVDPKIARLAHDIRDYYTRTLGPNEATITTPDAIHLATAIQMKCPTFYTFDGLNVNNKKNGMPLLPISENVAGQYNLKIMVPPSPQQHPLPDGGEVIETGIRAFAE